MSSLFIATGALFVGIAAIVVFLAVVLSSLNPYLARHQARARILREARTQRRPLPHNQHG